MSEPSPPVTFIRSIVRSDEEEFVDLMRRSEQLHDPWITPPTNAILFRYYINRCAQEDHEGYVVCRREDDAIIGAINVNSIVRGSFLSASLGYYVGAEFQGKGYMRDGLEQLLQHATHTMGLHRLEANIQPQNLRSKGLVQRCGFVYEGISKNFLYINGAWRDHERWCYLDPRSSLRSESRNRR